MTREQFYERTVRDGACLIWQRARTKNGYGECWHNKRVTYVHRWSYSEFIGPIPDGMDVLHTCDRPSCAEPRHLFLGDARSNALDMVRKGRARNGVQVGMAHHATKLTDDDVRAMRAQYARRQQGATLKDLAERYGLALATVHRIVTRQTWKYVV